MAIINPIVAKRLIGQGSRAVRDTIKAFGNDCTLPDGSTVRMIPAQKSEEFERIFRLTVTPEGLQELQGKLVLFKAHPDDMERMPPGIPIKWKNDTYYIQPSRDSDFDNTGVLRRIIASTGGWWLMTDRCAIFRDNGTFVAYTEYGNPVATPPGLTQYTGTIEVEGTLVPVSPELILSQVDCKFGYTDNVDDPAAVARLKRFQLETADFIFFRTKDIYNEAGQTFINNFCWVVNLCTVTDGSVEMPVPGFGTVSRIMGAPYLKISPSSTIPNITQYRIVDEENPPAGIAQFVADVIAAGYVPPTVTP